MHGLVNRAIECFVRDTYGDELWEEVARSAMLGFSRFESMLTYDDAQTFAVIDAASARLSKPSEVLLEDLGTYLVSNPSTEAIRRLMRFGGTSFVDFLHSLDDLADRSRLAVSDLRLPVLEMHDDGPGKFRVTIATSAMGFGYVLVGLLRAMADDYGALAFVEHASYSAGVETVAISLLEQRFAEGRSFELAARPAQAGA